MGKYLDFEKQEKGYEPFDNLSLENIRKHVGRVICYVTHHDKHRGYYTVHYGTIESARYSYIFFESGNQVDRRDIKECGINIITKENG